MILVIGDIIVDEFVMGDVSRISPEAPVPVVHVSSVDRKLGGSANVIRNLHAIEQSSAMFGVVGEDEAGAWVHQRLAVLDAEHTGVLTKENGRPTAIKTRVIARHQQLLRYDREWVKPLHSDTQQALLKKMQAKLHDAKAVILSDYAKGVLTPEFLTQLIPMFADKIIAIDPKPSHTQAYKGATFITPNLSEAAAMSGMDIINDDKHVETMARQLHADLQLKYILITRSERGMTLFDGAHCHHIPTAARDVFDVTGAGDTVIAVFTSCLVRGDSPLNAARIANQAAGVVVGKVGTATASWQEIQAYAMNL
ncbi:MAG: D-glycero-beta-D-manno-heptose-7-phosphate kinase [Mariprofundaceae bacterium]|nr:D-glycero-beta-D-manno-heptose-7-phosphate kinase [Mariprofundaceae bacterium]